MKKKGAITAIRKADENNQVVRVEGGSGGYMKEPCAQCPWRLDSPVGAFPDEAYRISANTAYDMADSTFACHMAGVESPKICAGFLLKNSQNNMAVRMKMIFGEIDLSKVSSPVPLYNSYREMAEANGVDPEDPVLRPCRADWSEYE